MEKILERYERYSYAEKQLGATDPESLVCPVAIQLITQYTILLIHQYFISSFR